MNYSAINNDFRQWMTDLQVGGGSGARGSENGSIAWSTVLVIPRRVSNPKLQRTPRIQANSQIEFPTTGSSQPNVLSSAVGP